MATKVDASTSDTLLLTANSGREAGSVYYDGAAILYLLAGGSGPSATNYSAKLGDGYLTYWETPKGFTGEIRGLWSAAVGSAFVTDYA